MIPKINTGYTGYEHDNMLVLIGHLRASDSIKKSALEWAERKQKEVLNVLSKPNVPEQYREDFEQKRIMLKKVLSKKKTSVKIEQLKFI